MNLFKFMFVLVFIFANGAWAQTTAAPTQPGAFEMLLPFLFIFVIFYFFIIRPQSKRQKEHQNFLSQLQKGESVITAGGLMGLVREVQEQYVSVEIADDVVVKVIKNQITASLKNQEGKNGKS